ncbi:MAG: purine-nucleoside phosphorylase, partial [Candidatus Nanohaloarchaea archaeon]|nr:purine-nucleoside phosphorylase [Candidatus Nanohaloarchaea archaeon]
DAVGVPYEAVPGFPETGVEGHAGMFVAGELEGRQVVAMDGRFHYYETGDIQRCGLPIRVMDRIGAETLLITNAAGGVNEEFERGDLMLIADHINLMGTNPLIGEHYDSFGPRFPDMSTAYSPDLREVAQDVAASQGTTLQEGVYAAVTGPSYETPAEIEAFRTLGVDAIGMSTVPEVIVANQVGMQVLGISSITNLAAGVQDGALSHEEVIETTDEIQDTFQQLVRGVLPRL